MGRDEELLLTNRIVTTLLEVHHGMQGITLMVPVVGTRISCRACCNAVRLGEVRVEDPARHEGAAGTALESIKASIEARKPDFDAYIDPQKKAR